MAQDTTDTHDRVEKECKKWYNHIRMLLWGSLGPYEKPSTVLAEVRMALIRSGVVRQSNGAYGILRSDHLPPGYQKGLALLAEVCYLQRKGFTVDVNSLITKLRWAIA